MRRASVLLTFVMSCGPSAAPPPAHPTTSWNPIAYRSAIDDALTVWLSNDPAIATLEGDHRFDDRWADLTREGQAHMIADLHAKANALRELAKTAPAVLTSDADRTAAETDRPGYDARLLADALDGFAEIATVVDAPEKDPSGVLFSISTGLDRILAHTYAPLPVRMASVAARVEKIPALLATVRGRLANPRRAGIEMTPVVAKGLIAMMQSPALHPSQQDLGGDAALAKRLADASAAATKALDDYQRSVVDAFPADKAAEQPIGADAWSRIARLREGVTTPFPALKQMANSELVRLQGELDALIAKTGQPSETREAFLGRMASDLPAPDSVLADYRATNERLETWLHEGSFVTVPWDLVKVEVTLPPPHARAFTMASMNQSGVLDQNSEVRFEVNAPTPEMPPPMQQAMRTFHAKGVMSLVSAHEMLPGHYLEFLHLRQLPSKVRKLLWTFHAVEGWAHYCEEAVLDAGYSDDSQQPGRARAFMLKLALQRATRMIVDLGEADGTLTLDAAAKRLEKDGFLAPEAARMEARRGMFWPVNMFAYTYGKLMIKQLRDAVRAKEGAQFSLRSFHDRFLSLGGPPVADTATLVFGVTLDSQSPAP